MNSIELYDLGTKLLSDVGTEPDWVKQACNFVEGYKALTEQQREYFWVEYQGEQHSVNQSRLTLFNDCKRKYWWQFEENLVPDKPQYALDFGKATHEALAALNSDKPLEEALVAAGTSFDHAMARVKFMPGEKAKADEFREYLLKLVTAYVNHWGEFEEWTVLRPEVQGRVEVGEGTGCFLVFRTDAVISWRKQAFLLEHKTMAQNRLDNWIKYQMDFQITAYIYALTKLLGIRIAGVIVNGLVKTNVPQFGREPYSRTDEELMEFEEEFVEQVRELNWRKRRVANGEPFRRIFYKNTHECFKYGQCPYRILCLKDNKVNRMLFLKREPDYVDDPKKLEVRHDKWERPIKEAPTHSGGESVSERASPDSAIRDAATRLEPDTDVPGDPPSSAGGRRKPTWGDLT